MPFGKKKKSQVRFDKGGLQTSNVKYQQMLRKKSSRRDIITGVSIIAMPDMFFLRLPYMGNLLEAGRASDCGARGVQPDAGIGQGECRIKYCRRYWDILSHH